MKEVQRRERERERESERVRERERELMEPRRGMEKGEKRKELSETNEKRISSPPGNDHRQ